MSDQQNADPYVVPAAESIAEPEAPSLSAAVARFVACRWHHKADAGVPAHCTHRDVLSMAGATGFSAESWCADCAHYKVKRIVRRSPFA
jgi:hypothetical protein